MAPDRAAPVMFEMIEPMRRSHQDRPLTDLCVGEANPIRGSTVANLLRQVRGRTARCVGSDPPTHRKHLDRLRDILQILQAELPELERELAVDLVVGLT